MAKQKLKVLFLCTGNSCRSQMAEGLARYLKSDEIEPYSAGVETHGLNPSAVRVMAELGVDISYHRSKHVSTLLDVPFDYVVTVCDDAHESCPVFPGRTKIVHVGYPRQGHLPYPERAKIASAVRNLARQLDARAHLRSWRRFREEGPPTLAPVPVVGPEVHRPDRTGVFR